MFLRNLKPPFLLRRFPPEVSIASDILSLLCLQSSLN